VPTAATTIGGGTSGTSYLANLKTSAVSPTITTGDASSGLGSMALRYGLGQGGQLVAGALQNRAAGKATDIQQRYLDEALAYTKEQDAYQRKAGETAIALEASRYGDREARLAPYRATGVSANSRMASLLGLPAPPESAPRTMAPSAAPVLTAGGPQAWAPAPETAAPAAPALVMIRAPNGQQQQVPADQVAHYTQKGGQVVS
jgi:hypothetical protein